MSTITSTVETTTAPAPPFTSEAVVRFLLHGPDLRSVMPNDPVTCAELKTAWGAHGERCGKTWREHETWLRQEAERRGIAPRWPHNRFFAEAVAAQKGQR